MKRWMACQQVFFWEEEPDNPQAEARTPWKCEIQTEKEKKEREEKKKMDR